MSFCTLIRKSEWQTWKSYVVNEDSSYHKYFAGNDLYGKGMSKELLVNEFGYVKNTSKFTEVYDGKW